MERHFTEEDTNGKYEHENKSCSVSLVIKKTQVKTPVRYYYIPIRTGKIKIMKTLSVGENTEKTGSLIYSYKMVWPIWTAIW
jgi:hypothetical protein